MLRKRARMTAAKLAANHRNAQRSTGPRRKRNPARDPEPSVYVQSVRDTMITLGEDPQEFGSFLKRLILEHQPATATEMMLVEDIALIEWERRRVERGQYGLLAREVEKAEIQCWKRSHELGEAAPAAYSREMLKGAGLRRAPDSRTKFDELLASIQLLIARAKKRDLSGLEAALKFVYGENPDWRGDEIVSAFNELLEKERTMAQDPSASAAQEPERGQLYKAFQLLLLREERNIAEEYEHFLIEHMTMTPAMRNALLAPSAPQWAVMNRQKNSIDRQIERKLKLLFHVQQRRQALHRGAGAEAPAGVR